MFVVFSIMGLGTTTAKYVAEYKLTNKLEASRIIKVTNQFSVFLGIIIAVGIILFAEDISVKSFNTSHLSTPIKIGAIILLLSSLNGVQTGCLAGFEKFKIIAINTFIAGFFELLFLCLGAYFYGVKGGIIGLCFSYFILWLLNWNSIKKVRKEFEIPKYNDELTNKDFRIIYKFSLPAALSSFLVMPVLWYCKSNLVKTSGFSELAIFDVSDQWKNIILFIPGSLSNIILPILSSINSENNQRDFINVFKLNLLINFLVSFFIALFVIIFAKDILYSYGKGFTNNLALIWLACSTIFTALAQVVGKIIASKEKMWTGFGFNLIWALSLLIVANILIPKFGSSGLAMAVFFSYVIHFVIQMVYVKFYFKFQNK